MRHKDSAKFILFALLMMDPHDATAAAAIDFFVLVLVLVRRWIYHMPRFLNLFIGRDGMYIQ